MKKIDILIPNFDDFGAQRVAINVANALCTDYEVNFVVFNDIGPFKTYLNKDIKITKLDYGFLDIPKFRIFPRFYRYIKFTKNNNTDISISFSPVANLVILFAKIFRKNLKTIIQEHGYPSLAIKDRQNMGRILEWIFCNIIFKLYNNSNIFLCITNAIKDDFVTNFGINEKIIRVVRNPVDIKKIKQLMDEPVTNFQFDTKKIYMIGIGRLVDQKNFFKLLNIFSKVRKNIPNVELIILGDGPDKERLIKNSVELKIDKYVHFLGFVKNPYNFLKQSNCYCLTSNWEGLPQVIAEAMICKTPVIANDCKSGPNEMIVNGTTGFLIPMEDDTFFVEDIIKLLSNKDLHQKISDTAYEFANFEYSIEQCIINYKEILNSLDI
jgi:glycosyltransferase involved in cell wall biosynthesis